MSHDWARVRKWIGYRWRCRRCGVVRKVRTASSKCSQLAFEP